MKKLIIAEKPSLSTSVMKAIGKFENHKEGSNGYFENENYIVTWALGHLLELKDIDDYLGEKIKWENINFPFVPKKFEYKIKDEEAVIKQVEIIKSLIEREDIEAIIHCGDADREGQIIIDTLLAFINNSKPVLRLWLPEQTEETIRYELRNAKNNSEYINLHNEGITRSEIDWLLGINLTTYLTVKSKTLLRVGRVLIPIVKFIYDREMAIKNFKVENYYQLESSLGDTELKLSLDKKYSEDEKDIALKVAVALNKNKAIIEKLENKEIKKYPSKLFSLSKLQNHLSKNNKMPFAKSEKIIQELYLKGYITYPRTKTQYLADNEKEKVKKILEAINLPDEFTFYDTKKIFDSSKVESHSAITITTKIPRTEDLTEDEKLVYKTIYNRFVSNFVKEEASINQIIAIIRVGEEIFTLKGEAINKLGFMKYEEQKIENKLPNFKEGDTYNIEFKAIKKKTTPPKKVTEEELGNFLENPFKTEKTTEEEEYKALFEGIEIGTVATRTGIIENAKSNHYISQKGSNYSIEPLGEKLIEILDKLKIDLYKNKTVEFSKLLKKIYKGEIEMNEVVDEVVKELDDITSKEEDIEVKQSEVEKGIGTCPICGKGQIYQKKSKEGKIFYNCSEEECKFFLWQDSKFFNNPIIITKEKLKNMLAGKKQAFKLKNKEGKEYEGYLKLKINGIYANFELDGFVNDNSSLGTCPICGEGQIYQKKSKEGKIFYTCSEDECKFFLWENSKFFNNPITITKEKMKNMLAGKKQAFKLKSKEGKDYEGYLKFKINGIYVNFELDGLVNKKIEKNKEV